MEKNDLLERAAKLRERAARVRQYAQYADGPAYYQDLELADRLIGEAVKIEKLCEANQ